MPSQITGVSIVYSTVCSDADQRKHQSPTSLAFVLYWRPVNSRYKMLATRKMFPYDDIIKQVGRRCYSTSRLSIAETDRSNISERFIDFAARLMKNSFCYQQYSKHLDYIRYNGCAGYDEALQMDPCKTWKLFYKHIFQTHFTK